jgi:hypothetical protein
VSSCCAPVLAISSLISCRSMSVHAPSWRDPHGRVHVGDGAGRGFSTSVRGGIRSTSNHAVQPSCLSGEVMQSARLVAARAASPYSRAASAKSPARSRRYASTAGTWEPPDPSVRPAQRDARVAGPDLFHRSTALPHETLALDNMQNWPMRVLVPDTARTRGEMNTERRARDGGSATAIGSTQTPAVNAQLACRAVLITCMDVLLAQSGGNGGRVGTASVGGATLGCRGAGSGRRELSDQPADARSDDHPEDRRNAIVNQHCDL